MIAISAGHFGKGTGASGYIDEVEEAIKVVRQVTKLLQLRKVAVTQIIDVQSTTQQQNLTYLKNAHNRCLRKIDVFVHFNATNKSTENAIGTEVLFKEKALEALATQLSDAISLAGSFKNRGAKYRDDLYVLNTSSVGGIVIEICFVNAKKDVEHYKQYFFDICEAMTDVLEGFIIGQPMQQSLFSSAALQEAYQQFMSNETFQQALIQQAIAQKTIQGLWLKKLEEKKVTAMDLCAISLLLVKKYIN